jgi:hypothetical protein
LRGPFLFCEATVKKRRRVTRARLRELLHYDEDTGEFRWRKRMSKTVRAGDVAGCTGAGRRRIGIDGRTYAAHHLAWFYMTGRWGRPTIDHRDGNPSNNRFSNLRPATSSQNNANRGRPGRNTSGFKGVSPSGGPKKWKASIRKNHQKIHLGYFATPAAAHEAYLAAARKLFGEFARAD